MESPSNRFMTVLATPSASEFARDGLISVSLIAGTDEYHVDCQLGCERATMETDRDSLVKLRDDLNELLDATEPAEDPLSELVISDAAATEFERIVEQYPMSTNLSLQRLLRRKKPWST